MKKKQKKPIVLCIMDGWGINENSEYNMVNQNGQIVKKGNLIFNSGAAQVHLPNLKAWLYTLTVKNSTASQSFKLIGGVIWTH